MPLETNAVGQPGQDPFAWLIDPLPTSEFQRDFYERRLCLVKRTVPSYYANLLGGEDLDTRPWNPRPKLPGHQSRAG